MQEIKTKATIIIKKVKDDWKIKNSARVSLPVKVFHNYRKKESEALKKLRSELKKEKEFVVKSDSSQKNEVPIKKANRNKFIRRRPINRKTAERTQNSLVNNPNIAIGIVSLLQPGAIASILRENNVGIPMSSSNQTSDNVPNDNKDINNNNNRSDASTCTREPFSNTRDDNDKDNFVNVGKITKSNQTKTLHKEHGNVKKTNGIKVAVLNMETQTDDLLEENDQVEVEEEEVDQIFIEEPVSIEQVPLEAPAVTVNNLPPNFISQEAMHQLCQFSDWNQFLLQTNMGQTQQDWFDPNAGERNAPAQKKTAPSRKRKATSIVEYDPDLFLARHMMPKNPARMSDFAVPQVPISCCNAPVIPSAHNNMASEYNTRSRSSLRLDPAYQCTQNIHQPQYMPQQPINVVQPMIYNTYQPSRHYPTPPPPPPPYRPMNSSRVSTRASRWPVSETQTSMSQYLPLQHQHHGTTAMRAHMVRAVQMPHQTFIDDPRRRTRK